MPNTIEHDHDITIDLRPSVRTDDHALLMTHREWLNLGVLCVTAADKAEVEGNYSAARYYAALAKKCDGMAAELPRPARGTIPVSIEK
jgi:hypothetical protein